MKKIIKLTLILSITLASVITPKKSEALVGLIFKNKVVKTIGAIGSIGGATVTGVALATGLSATSNGAIVVSLVMTTFGMAVTGIGLVILDDKQVADIEFKKIDLDSNRYNVSQSEISIYNQELDLLNSIRQTIIEEASESNDTADAEKLWLDYAKYLSPETFNLASLVAKDFIEAR